ncbi:MAG: transposase [Candidatus Cloacimonadales bacterium]|nr:transposase [Candidatus Cloacimonadales bacterium]
MSTYQDDCIYHIYNKGCNEELVFFDDSNYKLLIRKMIHNYEKYDVSIIAFCLMPNHYHMLLRQNSGGSILKFLTKIFSAYSEAVKKEQSISGDVFEGDPKFIRIEELDHLQNLIWYIHYNPLKASLVRRLETWKFSNFPECIGVRNAFPYDLNLINDTFGSTAEYKNFADKSKDDKIFELVKSEYLIDYNVK